MEEKKLMDFGRKYRVGNYSVLKHSRALSGKEMRVLRAQMGIPDDMRKYLTRGAIPYITVEAVSGIWSISFAVTTNMYRLVDEYLGGGDDTDRLTLMHMFSIWFADTTITGDAEYLADKARALKALVERDREQITKEADDKILEEVRTDEETKASIIEMADAIGKEGGDHEG